jgi:hypothetical protein
VTREQHQLAAIERRLRRSDPRLAEMFAVFTGQPNLRQGPVRERLTPWPSARRPAAVKVALYVVIACLLIATVVTDVMAVGGHHEGPPHGTGSTTVWGVAGSR